MNINRKKSSNEVVMSKKNNSVIRQASFLMAATMICRVIGILYRSPLHNVMGNVGDGYYTYAYEWYNILLLISSYSIPMAISKVMSERLALGQYKNASRVFKAAFLYVIVVGLISALAAYILAPVMLKGTEGAVPALRVLAPTIFFSGILGVLRGYFQARNSMKQTAVSQIAEQIVNAFISVFAAYAFTRPFISDAENTAVYGAAGGTLGTGAGVITGLIVMLLFFIADRNNRKDNLRQDVSGVDESYKDIFKVIIMMVTPVIIATFIYNIVSVFDQRIYTAVGLAIGTESEILTSNYGIFGYQYKPIINIPIALASATSTALIPAVASLYAKKETKGVVEKIDESVNFTMFLAIPSAFGLCVLSYPVIRILYPSADISSAAIMLSVGALSVIFYCLSTVTNGVLQGLGHPSVPVRNSLFAMIVNAAVLVIFMYLGFGIYSMLLAHIIYAIAVSVFNNLSIRKRISYRMNIKPLKLHFLSSVIMAAAVGAVYWIPALLLKEFFSRYINNAILTCIAVIIGILVYIITFAALSGKSDDELRRFPMGTKMLKILRILHIRK